MRKITLKFFPNDRKVNSKTGKTPIYMTVNFKGVQVTKRLDWELISEERLNWNEILQRVDHQESYTNRFLDGIQLKFTQLKFSEFKDIQRMSVHEIRDYIIGNSNDSNKTLTIIEYALNYYDNNIDFAGYFSGRSNFIKDNFFQLDHSKMKIYKVDLLPGDSLCIPPWWLHAVQGFDHSISITKTYTRDDNYYYNKPYLYGLSVITPIWCFIEKQIFEILYLLQYNILYYLLIENLNIIVLIIVICIIIYLKRKKIYDFYK